jgi:hypothetical protein
VRESREQSGRVIVTEKEEVPSVSHWERKEEINSWEVMPEEEESCSWIAVTAVSAAELREEWEGRTVSAVKITSVLSVLSEETEERALLLPETGEEEVEEMIWSMRKVQSVSVGEAVELCVCEREERTSSRALCAGASRSEGVRPAIVRELEKDTTLWGQAGQDRTGQERERDRETERKDRREMRGEASRRIGDEIL